MGGNRRPTGASRQFAARRYGDESIRRKYIFTSAIARAERVIEGTVTSDSGAMIRDGIKTVAKQGVCSEKQAQQLGADAVVDLTTTYAERGLCMTGTAVKLR